MHYVPNLEDTGLMATVRPVAHYDEENYRFVITPLFPEGVMPLHKALVAIKHAKDPLGHCVTWRALAEFCGMRQSDIFKATYCSPFNNCMARKRLQPYLVIDVDLNTAYFYRRDKLPEGITPVHIGPTITNKEDKQTITEKIPTKVTTRVKINYPYTDSLIMTLTPENGYLLGIKDITLAQPNHTYVVSGSARTLTDLLTRIHFVATQAGDASIVIKVDDGSNEMGGIASTTVSLLVQEGITISVPELIVPEGQTATLMEESSFEAIQVADEDEKFMQLRITPFGCKIINFTNSVQPLLPGNVRNVYGRPDTINEDIAHLAIVPSQENAQIGLELICDTTRIRKYMVFDVTVPGDTEDTEEGGDTPALEGNPEAQAAGIGIQSDAVEVQDAAQQVAEQSLQADAATGNIPPQGIVGESGASLLLNYHLPVAEYEGPITVTLKPIRCTLSNGDQTIAHNKTMTLTGSYAEVEEILSQLAVNVGTQNGRVDIKFNGEFISIQVEVSTAE